MSELKIPFGHKATDVTADPRQIKLEDFGTSGHALKCPCCGGNNLHQITTETVFRFAEDGSGLMVVHDESNEVASVPVPANGIAGRRNNIYIYFECEEGCAEDQVLCLLVQQHKGLTYIKWLIHQLTSPEQVH